MENNTRYLEKMHWVLLLGVVAGIPHFLRPLFTPENFSMFGPLTYGFGHLIFFIALGFVTNKWREAGIAWMIRLGIHILNIYFFDKPGTGVPVVFMLYILDPLPVFLFIGMITGWKKPWIMYLMGFVLQQMLDQGTGGGAFFHVSLVFFNYFEVQDYLVYAGAIYRIAMLATWIIFICELINYCYDRGVLTKRRLLNSGNEYPKTGTLAAFWALKTTLWLTIITGTELLLSYTNSGSYEGTGMPDSEIARAELYHMLMPFMTIGWALFVIVLGWYLRKMLLEYMVTYDLTSKMVYWCSLLPLIGTIVLFISSQEAKPLPVNDERAVAWQKFTADDKQSVFIISIALLMAQFFLFALTGSAGMATLAVMSIFFFIWSTRKTSGFYIFQGLNAFGLIMMGFLLQNDEVRMRPDDKMIVLFTVYMLLQITFACWQFAVFHHKEFEYDIPLAQAEGNEEFHLFPPIK